MVVIADSGEMRTDLERGWCRAYKAAQSCARRLRDVYGVHQVYLIGSMSNGQSGGFHAESDIDLAVEGLRPSCYFRALADLWRRLPAGLELDLIPLEYAHPGLRERVPRDGIPLLP